MFLLSYSSHVFVMGKSDGKNGVGNAWAIYGCSFPLVFLLKRAPFVHMQFVSLMLSLEEIAQSSACEDFGHCLLCIIP